jgi:hypothetical protein
MERTVIFEVSVKDGPFFWAQLNHISRDTHRQIIALQFSLACFIEGYLSS